MKKKLPEIKKNLKSFILGEDASLTDKTFSKIALSVSAISAGLLFSSEDVNAQGHSNHTNHCNEIGRESDYAVKNESERGANTDQHQDENYGNNELEDKEIAFVAGSPCEFSSTIEVLGKSVKTVHGNHYNHNDGGGKS